jgi:hypothetical protein
MRKNLWADDASPNWIDGGLTEDEAVTLRKLAESVAQIGMIGFEIGCYTGWTACQVLPIFKANSGRYHVLDWFRGSIDTKVGPYFWEADHFDSKKVLLALLGNIEALGFGDIATVTIAKGEQLGHEIADGVADYIYIGADHRYSDLKRDIETWMPKLRPGGVICGHAFTGDLDPTSERWKQLEEAPEQDYYASDGFHFGVARAVREMVPNFERAAQIWWGYKSIYA